jgi:hypothetical protein
MILVLLLTWCNTVRNVRRKLGEERKLVEVEIIGLGRLGPWSELTDLHMPSFPMPYMYLSQHTTG